MGLPNPWILLAALLVVIGAFGYGMRVGANQEIAHQKTSDEIAQAVEDRTQKVIAEAIAKNRPIYRTQTQVLEREIQKVPDYSRCKHSDDSLRALNAALEDRPYSASDLVLPEADGTDGSDVRSNDAQAGGSDSPVLPVPRGGGSD